MQMQIHLFECTVHITAIGWWLCFIWIQICAKQFPTVVLHSDVLRYSGLREKLWITGNCQGGVDVNVHGIWKEQNVFPEYECVTVQRCSWGCQGQGKGSSSSYFPPLLLWVWKSSDRRLCICFLLPLQVPWAPGWLPWLWASPASSPTAPCAFFFRAGRLSPRTPLHHPLLACLSPAKNNILTEKSSHGWHYPVQDEKHPSISLSPASLVFNSYVISFSSSIFSFLCCFVQGCWIVMLHKHRQPLPQGSSP